jgi:hypothetical protein
VKADDDAMWERIEYFLKLQPLDAGRKLGGEFVPDLAKPETHYKSPVASQVGYSFRPKCFRFPRR